MLVKSIGAAVITLGTAHGLANSAPFFLRSTQPYVSLEGKSKARTSMLTRIADSTAIAASS